MEQETAVLTRVVETNIKKKPAAGGGAAGLKYPRPGGGGLRSIDSFGRRRNASINRMVMLRREISS
jgi:hypothetical protein